MEPGPFHEGRGADDVVPGINMRTGKHNYYGILGNLPFKRGFEEGVPTVYSDLAGQMRRYGATGTGSILNPIRQWVKNGIFRPEYWALLKSNKITIGEKYDTFLFAQFGLQNLFMLLIIGIAVGLAFLRTPNDLAIGFINGVVFATVVQLSATVYFQLQSLKDRSVKKILKTVFFAPALFFGLIFHNAIGAGYDLLMGKAKSYGATAIRKSSDKKESVFVSTLRKNKFQIFFGFLALGISSSLLFYRIFVDAVINTTAMIVYLVYLGLSLIINPFMFTHKNKTSNERTKAPSTLQIAPEKKQTKTKDKAMAILNNAQERRIESDRQPVQNGIQKGGIDLAATATLLHTLNKSDYIKYHISPSILQSVQNTTGLVPVIVSIRPVGDLIRFLTSPSKV